MREWSTGTDGRYVTTPHTTRRGDAATFGILKAAVTRARLGTPLGDTAVGDLIPRRRQLWRWARALLLGMACVVAVPVALVTWNAKQRRQSAPPHAETRWNLQRERREMFAPNPAITPSMGTAALLRVLRHGQGSALYLPPLDSAVFPSIVLPFGNTDHAQLIRVAGAPLTPAQRAWLEQVAIQPWWADVDVAARAPAFDLLGAAAPGTAGSPTNLWDVARFDAPTVRRLNGAMVARAAWHVSRGETARADSLLRRLVTLGLVAQESTLHPYDIAAFRSLVNTGMRTLAVMRNEPGSPPPPVKHGTTEISQLLRDATVPRSRRMALAALEPEYTCRDVRVTLFGESASQRSARENAVRALARSEQEWQLLRAISTESLLLEQEWLQGEAKPAALRVMFSMASTVAAVTRNPRLAICAGQALISLNRRWQ